MPRRLPKYCVEDVDRHGNVRVYLRRNGRKIRIVGTPWTEPFMAAYAAAMQTMQRPEIEAGERVEIKRSAPGTLRWLGEQYFAGCADYLALEPSTRDGYRRSLEGAWEEPIEPGSVHLFGDMPIARATPKALRVLRDRKMDAKEAGNARVKALRGLFRFAVEYDHATTNPADSVPYFKTRSKGHHTWTVAEVEAYEARHPIGTTARLALAILLYTGVRRSDAVRIGPQHASDGWLRFTAFKNRNRSPIEINIPILPTLAAVIEGSAKGHLAYLVTKFGKPYSMGGFSGQFKDWCVQAGLPHCCAHGLRKAGATLAAEAGATERQLMAIFGWSDAKTPSIYTRAADRKRMAGAGMGLIETGRSEYNEVPPSAEMASSGTKTA